MVGKALLISLLAVASAFRVNVGLIKPKTSQPIVLQYNNLGYTSTYTFSFQISTATPASAVLAITFPADSYSSGLGISTAPSCTAVDQKGNAYSSCTVSGLVVTIGFGNVSNSPVDNTYTVVLQGVTNPNKTGGTGFFILQTWKGINLLDDNESFAKVGIYPAAGTPNSASVVCSSATCLVNKSSQYTFTYTPSQTIPITSVIQLTFPSQLSQPNPPICTSTSIPSVVCSIVGQIVTISGLTSPLKSSTSYSVVFSNVQNPWYVGTLSNFSLMVLQGSANNIIEATTAITGPSITGDSLTVSVCPNAVTACSASDPVVSISNTMYYTISVTTSTNIPANGLIVATIPAGYTLISGTCLVVSGLTNYATTIAGMVACTVSTSANTVTISSFGLFLAGTFSFKFQATNPSSSGSQGSVSIVTYYDSAGTKSIDLGSTSLSVTNVNAPTSWTWTWSSTLTPNSNPTASVLFKIPAGVAFPGSSITISFPTGFSFNGAPTATITDGANPNPTVTASFSSSTGLLTLTSTSSYTFSSTVYYTLALSAASVGIYMPATAGSYYVQVQFITATPVISFLSLISVSGATMVGSATAFNYDTTQKTAYALTFTPTITVPASSISSNISSSWGQIQVLFSTNTNLWQLDLGTGLSNGGAVSCIGVSNFVAVTGSSLSCTLTLGTARASTSYATVTITGFQQLTAGTAVTIHLADLQNIDSASIQPSIQIILNSNVQSISTQTNSATYQFPTASATTSPTINGQSPSPNGDGSNIVTLTPNTVSLSSVLSFVIRPEYTLATSSCFIFEFPTYIVVPASVSCTVNYFTANTCYSYPSANWIILVLSASSMAADSFYTITITGFTNPKDTISIGSLSAIEIDTTGLQKEYLYFEPFSTLNTGAISPVSVIPSSYIANAVDVTYSWIFTLTNNIEQGGSIVLSFPKENYVTTTSPALQCVISGALSAISASNPIACTFSGNTVTISNFAAFTAGSAINIQVLGVLNPSTPTTTSYFYIETFSARGSTQDTNYNIPEIVIYDEALVGKLTHNWFSADPSNGNAVAYYTISFTPSVTYPVNTYIYIVFPSNFNSINSSPTCYVSGGFTTMLSCTSDGAYTITIVTDTQYLPSSGAPLNFTIAGITSFAGGQTSAAVTITAKYSGVTIDISPNNQSNRKFTTAAAANTMAFNSYYYDPVTPAEPANYYFTLQPQTSFTPNCTLTVSFPSVFPRRLADFLSCSSSQLSTSGSLYCYANSRDVVISGTNGWTASTSSSFNVTVSGVYNPSSGSSISGFIVYTKCGTVLYDYVSETVSTNSFSSLPAYSWLWYDTSSSYYNLYNSTVTLMANTSVLIPGSNNDILFVDFPSDYNFTFVASQITCDGLITNASSTSPFTLLNNRFTVYPYSSSVDSSKNPEVGVVIANVENPTTIGEVPYARLSVYQYSTRKVVSSTYPNLAQTPSLSYMSAGLIFTINYNQPISLNVGTRSHPLYGTLQSAATTNAVLTPTTLPLGVSMYPSSIYYYYGETTQSFQISVSANVTAGIYFINWEIATPGITATVYSPVQRTELIITNYQNETIRVSPVVYVPQGGTTLPINVTLSNPVDSGLVLKVVKIGSLPSSVYFTPANLTFLGGDWMKTFRITVDPLSTGENGEFVIFASGADSGSYNLLQSDFTYVVTQPTGIAPDILAVSASTVDFTTATFQVFVDKISTIYWKLGIQGTLLPSFASLAGTSNATNLTTYSYLEQSGAFTTYSHLANSTLQYLLPIGGLTAQTPYSFFAYVQDLDGNLAANIIVANFTTRQQFDMAYVTMRFLQSSLGDGDKANILNAISEILGINVTLLDYMTNTTLANLAGPLNEAQIDYDAAPTAISKPLRATQSTTLAYVVIYPDVNSSSTVSPLAYANMLSYQTLQLSDLLPTFDSSYNLEGSEINNFPPTFPTSPTFYSTNSTTVEVSNLSLDQNGTVYFCAIKANMQPPNVSPWQVVRGVNSVLQPCDVKASVLASPLVSSYELTGLSPLTKYWLFIAAKNLMQMYPAVSETVIALGFQTTADVSSGLVIALTCIFGLVLN